MRNEEKIIALLTEYIQKTDAHDQQFKAEMLKVNKEMLEVKKELVKQSSDQNDLKREQNQIQQQLSQTNIRQEELMKEIFRISKRVKDVEDGLS